MVKIDKKKMSIYNDITIIIVCYKSHDLIKKNLNSLKPFKTIIVDNSNCIKTKNLVKNYANIRLIKTSKNLGYGKANNIGVSYANTEFILILNPDILIDEKSIIALYNKKNSYDNMGILVPSLFSPNNEKKTNGSRSFLKKNFINKLKHNKDLPVGDACYDYAIGCAFFMERNFFNKIGGFDEDFFMYFEDNELCDRVYNFDKTVIETPASKMIHLEGMSSKKHWFSNCKLSVIHKISEFIYLNKNLSKFNLYKNLLIQFFDYMQRTLFGIITLNLKKFLKNFLRILSILMYISSIYKLI